MAKQTFSVGQVLTAAQMTSLQETAMGGGAASAKTASYVLVAADAGTTISMTSTSSTTITVNTGLFSAGDTVFIQNLGSGTLTITAGTATVNTAGSLILPQYDAGILYFVSASSAIFYDYIQVGATSPLTTKGDIYVYGTSDTRLPVGTNNTRLIAASGETTGLKYVADTQNTVIDAEGDLLVGDSADTLQRLAIGTTGQVLTVDTAVDGKIKWATAASGSFVGVQVTKTANTSVGAGANVQIPWDSEEFKTDTNFHSNTTNNARLTVPTGLGGYYKVYFAMQWASSATVARRIVAVYKNGNSSTGTFINNFETSSINFPSCAMSFTMNLSAGDWIEIDAYQGTASALDFRSSNAIFGMEKIG